MAQIELDQFRRICIESGLLLDRKVLAPVISNLCSASQAQQGIDVGKDKDEIILVIASLVDSTREIAEMLLLEYCRINDGYQ